MPAYRKVPIFLGCVFYMRRSQAKMTSLSILINFISEKILNPHKELVAKMNSKNTFTPLLFLKGIFKNLHSANKVKTAAVLSGILAVTLGASIAFSSLPAADAAPIKGDKIEDIVPSQTIVLDSQLGYSNLDSCSATGDYKIEDVDQKYVWFNKTITSTKYRPSGSATFRWNNCGYDSTGARIDAVITISNACVWMTNSNTLPNVTIFSLTWNRIRTESEALGDADDGSHRCNVQMNVNVSFYHTGTSTLATGRFVSKVLDLDANNGDLYENSLNESITLSGHSNVYMQNNCNVGVNGNRYYGTGLSDTNDWDAGIVYTAGGSHNIYWEGSRACSTTLLSQFNVYEIVATSGTGGSISSPGTTIVGWKGSKTYTMTPKTGYILKDVKVDGKSIGKVSSYTFSNVTANHTIHVDWQPLGAISLTKKSADTSLSVTDRYSISGAEYKLYSDSACATLAKDAYGNYVTLTTNASGTASTAKVLMPGTYYLKETKASKGYRLDTTAHPVVISNTGNTVSITSSEPPQRGTIKLTKKSSAPSWTASNNCYTLAGAVYKVYRDGKEVATLTTDATGNTNTFTAPLGKYTVKETVPSTGYRLDETTYTVDIATDNQTENISSSEVPLIDTYPLKLHKLDADAARTGKGSAAQGGLSLAGAKYKVSYYDGYYSTLIETAALPAKWVIETYTTAIDENGQATFTVSDADKFDDGTGAKGWPLGTYVIEETEAPFGYYLDDKDPYITQITKADANKAENNIVVGSSDTSGVGSSASASNPPSTLITESNALISTEVPKRADLMIMKFGETTGNPDETPEVKVPQKDVSFDIINNNECDVYRVDAGTWAAPSEVVYRITTDEDGYASTQDIAAAAGVLNALPCGNYIVHEDPATAKPGYAPMTDKELTVTTPEKIYHWIIENKVGTPLCIQKLDTESGNAIRGFTSFSIYDEQGNIVSMKEPYPSNSTISVFTTDITGSVRLPQKLMPGKYSIKEIKAPDGYLRTNQTVEFVADASTVSTWDKPLNITFNDIPVKGKITVGNIDAETEKPIISSHSIIEVYAKEDIITPDGVCHAKKGDLVYTGTTTNGYFETPELYLGNYYVKQIEEPNGYLPNERTYDVVLPYQGDETPIATASIDVPNIPQKGDISLVLNDAESHLPILTPNAIYKIVAAEDIITPDGTRHHAKGETIDYITTDETGHGTSPSPLYLGKYEIIEEMAPDNYVIDRDPIFIELVFEKGKESVSASAVDENMPQKGHIKIVKMDAETGRVVPVEGAVFSIIAARDIRTGDNILHYANNQHIIDIETDESGIAQTSKPLYLGLYTIKEIKAPEGYMLNTANTATAELAYVGQEETLTHTAETGIAIYNVPAKGKADIQKIDAGTKKPLLATGVLIEIIADEDIITPDGTLHHKKGDSIAVVETDEHGIAHIEDLYIGKYVAIERSAPDGYIVNPNPQSIEITYIDDKTPPSPQKATIEDTPITGKIEVIKADAESGKELIHSPAVFELYSKDDIATIDGTVRARAGEKVDTLTTENGRAQSKTLFPGTYIVKEISAPDGYLLDDTEYTIVLESALDASNNMAFASLTVEDALQKGRIEVIKIDEETALPILRKNVELDIVAAEDIITPDGTIKHHAGDIVETILTDENGHAQTGDLYIGKYQVIEKMPPDGYLSNSEPLEVEIAYDKEAGNIVEVSVEHPNLMPRGTIIIEKIDGADKTTPIVGAKFSLVAKEDIAGGDGTIYFEAQQEVEKGETNDEGKLIFEHLRQGKYIIVETEAPEGYMTAEDREVEISYKYDPNADETDAENGDESADTGSNEGAGNIEIDENIPAEDEGVQQVAALAEQNTGDNELISPEDQNTATDSKDDTEDKEDAEDTDASIVPDEEEEKDLIKITETIYDMPIQLLVSKTDENGSLLAGCTLSIYEYEQNAMGETGEKIDTWESASEEAHLVSPITCGTYILVEESACEGYEIAEPVVFEVVEQSEPNEIVMINKKAALADELVETPVPPAPPAPIIKPVIELVKTGGGLPLAILLFVPVSIAFAVRRKKRK